MNLKFPQIIFCLGLTLGLVLETHSQSDAPVVLKAKVRDFKEKNPTDPTNTHPDFNTNNCGEKKNAVLPLIDTTGLVDTAVFKGDHRNPKLNPSMVGNCFTSQARFDEWYNDRDPSINRSYLIDLEFTEISDGLYQYNNPSFFPLDRDSVYQKIKPTDPDPFGHLQSGSNAAHNFGLTMEFHTTFAYKKGENQIFTFKGDDDVWVFINDRLAIDIGGVHGAITRTVNLDQIAGTFGLVDNQNYTLDFFSAERHTSASNIIITTTLELIQVPPEVNKPVANPEGGAFLSQVVVSISTSTEGATIHYTTNGSTPTESSPVYTGPVTITQTTTLQAIAVKEGYKPSPIMTEVYTKTFRKSRLTLLNQDGNPFPEGFISEKDLAYTVRVQTTQAGLSEIKPDALTTGKLDKEVLSLKNPVNSGDELEYKGKFDFAVISTPATSGNNKLEASPFDLLIVTWKNPRDAADIAADTLLVRPAKQAADLFFTATSGADQEITQYVGDENNIFIVVKDQLLTAGKDYSVTIKTISQVPGQAGDDLTLPLTSLGGGKFGVTVPVSRVPTPITSDKVLQVLKGDQITASYTDPVDGDSDKAQVGYGVPAQILGEVVFTNADGTPFTGTRWDPTGGKIYLTFTDDWAGGTATGKTVAITITNNNGKSVTDEETLPLVGPTESGDKGIYKGEFTLADRDPVPGDKILQFYIEGRIKATVKSHSNAGTLDGNEASDEMLIAYPDKNAVLTIKDSKDSTIQINRGTEGVNITLIEQSFSSGTDTLLVDVSCDQSGDIVRNVMLIEVSPGQFQTPVPVAKNEGGKQDDNIISCRDSDILKVTYVDPVYKTPTEVSAQWDGGSPTTITFSSDAAGNIPITSVIDGTGFFYVVVQGKSPTRQDADIIQVTLITPQGETETFPAKETGAFSEKFIAKVPFTFITGSPSANNKILEGAINALSPTNRVIATAKSNLAQPGSGEIILISNFNLVTSAYIKDDNQNGRGDAVYFVFDTKLSQLPASLEQVYWNTVASENSRRTTSFTILPGSDSTVLVADFSQNEFAAGLTFIPEGAIPYALFPNNGLFGGQKPPIADSLGPIIVSAIKKPSDMKAQPQPDGSLLFNPDTLIVKVSEKLTTASDWLNLIRFSNTGNAGCKDYDKSEALKTLGAPVPGSDGVTWTVIVDNKPNSKTPLVGNCLYLNADGNYTDAFGNIPPKQGTELKGSNSDKVIQVFRGYPAVAGMDGDDPRFLGVNNDLRKGDKGVYTQQSKNGEWYVEWIPPVGWTPGQDFKPFIPKNAGDLPQAGSTDITQAQALPFNSISTIQVVSTMAYVAQISIFDNLGHFLRSFEQAFGYQGELNNRSRIADKGLVSYLVWDMKDHKGQIAGQGAYVWKVLFSFGGTKQEVQITRTGILRSP